MKLPLRGHRTLPPRPLRHKLLSCVLTGLAFASVSACTSTPRFVPAPAKIYARYSAIDEPREHVPVGALWVQGYGPYGEGAGPDNLVTIRSLSGLSVSGDLQLTLTLGLASVLNLEPAYRKRISAKFSDISIVRVKDPSKLAGPVGEPRIYEALKAGSITITAEKALGVDLNATAKAQNLIILGRGDLGQTQAVTIDGKDLFLAFRVVTPGSVRSRSVRAVIRAVQEGAEAVAHGHIVKFDTGELERCICGASTPKRAAQCRADKSVPVLLSRRSSANQSRELPVASYNLERDRNQAITLILPLPVSDGRGGLFTSLSARVMLDIEIGSSGAPRHPQCAAKIKEGSWLDAVLSGNQLRSFPNPSAPTW